MDVREVLSKVSGLDKKEVNEIWEKVKVNQKRLRECEGPHNFEQKGEGLRATFVCHKCQGELKSHEHIWYMRGLEHGKK